MLRELCRFENLGTVGILTEVLKQISNGGVWTVAGVEEYLSRRIIDNRNIFDGCILFGAAIGAIRIGANGILSVPNSVRNNLATPESITSHLRSLFCEALVADADFTSIFASDRLSFDSIRGRAMIENAAFEFRFASWRRAMLDFGVLEAHTEIVTRSFWLCRELEQLIEENASKEWSKAGLSQDQLYRKLQAQREAGALAERFVVKFERRRLLDHPQCNTIRSISTLDVTAGFDIVSFDSIESKQIDRFIEVKSYTGNIQFYWSRNEREVAKQRRKQYYIYLVDRSKIEKPDYAPLMIADPTEYFSKATNWISHPEIILMTRL